MPGVRGVARILFTVISAVSLVVLAVALWGWVRSYEATDYLAFSTQSRTDVLWVGWYKGSLTFNHVQTGVPMPVPRGFTHVEYRPPPQTNGMPQMAGRRVHFDSAGFIHATGRGAPGRPGQPGGAWFRFVGIPLWAVVAVAAVLPAAWAMAFWRGRRGRVRCGGCGAAVRATDATCPECGWPVARPAAAKAT